MQYWKKILGRWHRPFPRWEGDTPSPPRRLRRLDPCACGARPRGAPRGPQMKFLDPPLL